ncbi:saccharopine dehydrogenase family protein [Desulfurivibrio dismutans]|uniref:saccharopine dehydrogenase family protein n=1 Tax=Desulfurivibrio dismutans TaxID=1398908 RepID=UPI0023DAB9C8|nr:saccharopine dehydrogenase family protein [Desulfurivibrio alkaliphilus]MDF1614120.1 saccharopine dehydrogenase family protein [Desulfurivibrio alkaliphilus]
MSKVLIIGAGGVGSVAAHKCAQVPEVFSEIVLASRSLDKCEAIRDSVRQRTGREIEVARVDADNKAELIELIRRTSPVLVLHLALPYQDLTIMDACLECGVDYLDTANYESPDNPIFNYSKQWPYHDSYRDKGIMGLLGSGFDPGVTNVFCAYAAKHYFDEIHYIDILDANGGDHGYPFATNFNPEINIREVTARGRYWENGQWVDTEPMEKKWVFDFPGVGPKDAYLLYHEELESLVKNIKGLKRIRFWMTFSEQYLKHLEVLGNVGMTSIEPVMFEGKEIVPLQFLKALLPDPASLGPRTRGKTCIGNIMEGVKDGKPRKIYIYNNCDHEECYREVGSQAVSYTTGVPAMIGAMLMVNGTWRKPGIYNMEQLDPDPFMEQLNRHGLPWQVKEL